MLPLANIVRTFQVQATTTAARLASNPAQWVYIQADPANATNVRILGVGTNGNLDTAGIVLAPGGVIPLMRIDDTADVAIQAVSGTPNVNIMVLN